MFAFLAFSKKSKALFFLFFLSFLAFRKKSKNQKVFLIFLMFQKNPKKIKNIKKIQSGSGRGGVPRRPGLFEKYEDYLLGDYCYGLRSNEAGGSLAPPWTLVLSNENAIRKNAYKQMVLKGIGFADALVQSWKDAATKERQFTTPLCLCAKRPQPWSWDRTTPEKPGKKGTGKGKDSNKKAKLTKDTFNRTENGKPICFRFNSKGGCKKGAKCHFAHVCTKCRGEHSARNCPGASASAPTAAAN